MTSEATYKVASLRRYERRVMQQGRVRHPRYIEVTPSCWMCAEPRGGSTKEHVFPKWMATRFDDEELTFAPVRLAQTVIPTDERGSMPLQAMTMPTVCASCNNGWMSSLEAEANRLIFGDRRSLTTRQVADLARWFVKTAVVVNLSQTAPLLWQPHERHRLSDSIPPRVRVSLFRVPEWGLNWVQGQPPVIRFDKTRVDHYEAGFYCALTHVCRILVGDLVGVVVRPPWQLSQVTFDLPGELVWDGAPRPVDLDALPELPDWHSGIVAGYERHSPTFWTGFPPRDFYATTAQPHQRATVD